MAARLTHQRPWRYSLARQRPRRGPPPPGGARQAGGQRIDSPDGPPALTRWSQATAKDVPDLAVLQVSARAGSGLYTWSPDTHPAGTPASRARASTPRASVGVDHAGTKTRISTRSLQLGVLAAHHLRSRDPALHQIGVRTGMARGHLAGRAGLLLIPPGLACWAPLADHPINRRGDRFLPMRTFQKRASLPGTGDPDATS